jgi:hypothetical protein
MKRTLFIAALLFAPALSAQSPQPIPLTSIYTPEIHLGSATEPSTITVPPLVEVPAQPAEAPVSNAPPASTNLLASRHFDFITSPLSNAVPGSMSDTSISLGEYARRLRARKHMAATPAPARHAAPGAMGQPAKSK